MTIEQAAKAGISRISKPGWLGYGRIHLVNGKYGPWFRYYEREIQEAAGLPTPQAVLVFEIKDDDFVEFKGVPDKEDI